MHRLQITTCCNYDPKLKDGLNETKTKQHAIHAWHKYVRRPSAICKCVSNISKFNERKDDLPPAHSSVENIINILTSPTLFRIIRCAIRAEPSPTNVTYKYDKTYINNNYMYIRHNTQHGLHTRNSSICLRRCRRLSTSLLITTCHSDNYQYDNFLEMGR